MTATSSKSYHVYTRKFDREVGADRLDSVLGPISATDKEILRQTWVDFEIDLGTFWQGWNAKSRKDADHSDTVVTLLLDQSGSIKGQPMIRAAIAIKAAERFLLDQGCKVEILGFTTASWCGGRSRRRWRWRLGSKRPGRLCDLLHVVYRNADAGGVEMPKGAFMAMLRPDLPKDNIDGEAIIWAAGRLRSRPETRKILVVLSDGSPLDQSTLTANGALFLDEHLQAVLADLSRDPEVELAALGLGHDVSGWYTRSKATFSSKDLQSSILGLLTTILTDEAKGIPLII